MLVNFSKWDRGTSAGVARVAPYMALPPFFFLESKIEDTELQDSVAAHEVSSWIS